MIDRLLRCVHMQSHVMTSRNSETPGVSDVEAMAATCLIMPWGACKYICTELVAASGMTSPASAQQCTGVGLTCCANWLYGVQDCLATGHARADWNLLAAQTVEWIHGQGSCEWPTASLLMIPALMATGQGRNMLARAGVKHDAWTIERT